MVLPSVRSSSSCRAAWAGWLVVLYPLQPEMIGTALVVWGVLVALEILFWGKPTAARREAAKRRLYRRRTSLFYIVPAEYLLRLGAVAVVLTVADLWGNPITGASVVGATPGPRSPRWPSGRSRWRGSSPNVESPGARFGANFRDPQQHRAHLGVPPPGTVPAAVRALSLRPLAPRRRGSSPSPPPAKEFLDGEAKAFLQGVHLMALPLLAQTKRDPHVGHRGVPLSGPRFLPKAGGLPAQGGPAGFPAGLRPDLHHGPGLHPSKG